MRRRFGAKAGRWALTRALQGDDHVLLSSNAFGDLLAEGGFAETIARLAGDAGFARINVLMSIRDPLDHLTAIYLDDIGRRGGVARFEEAADAFDQPEQAAIVLDRCDAEPFATTVLNHSRVQDGPDNSLADELAHWLGLAPDALSPPHPSPIRALTGAEAAFQRALNAQLGTTGQRVADALCAGQADANAEAPRLPAIARRALVERIRPATEAVNARIAAAHAYRLDCDSHARPGGEGVTISRADLRRIADVLAQNVRG